MSTDDLGLMIMCLLLEVDVFHRVQQIDYIFSMPLSCVLSEEWPSTCSGSHQYAQGRHDSDENMFGSKRLFHCAVPQHGVCDVVSQLGIEPPHFIPPYSPPQS